MNGQMKALIVVASLLAALILAGQWVDQVRHTGTRLHSDERWQDVDAHIADLARACRAATP